MDTSSAGFVYLLQMEGHNYYKIGRTLHLSKRVTQIRPQMPGRLIPVFAFNVKDMRLAESNLHNEFAHKRLNGEWFRLEPIDIKEIHAALSWYQTFGLYERLATMAANSQGPSDRLIRICHALYRVSIRRQRRFMHYVSVNHERVEREESAELDSILNAEVVG